MVEITTGYLKKSINAKTVFIANNINYESSIYKYTSKMSRTLVMLFQTFICDNFTIMV